MTAWPIITIHTILGTQERTISWSPSIEEFIAKLQQTGEKVIVTKGSCRDCMYTPDRTPQLKTSDMQHLEQMAREEMAVPECGCCTVARHRKRPVPEFVVCYGFFYTHWWKNPILSALKEANLLSFLDVSAFPTLDEEKLKLYGTPTSIFWSRKELSPQESEEE